jgi:pimeloyl-ACP methyl ester carboxylesterase
VLIIRSELDFWSRAEDVAGLRAHLVNAASVEAVTLEQATHFVHLDRPSRGRDDFLLAVIRLLDGGGDHRPCFNPAAPCEAAPSSGTAQ